MLVLLAASQGGCDLGRRRRGLMTPMPDELAGPRGRWLLLIQQLPTRPSSARIKTWRRLQQIGSVVLKNSVYVLPHTPQAREDFEWLATEIRAANGQASILAADALTSEQESEIQQAFRAARAVDYEALRGKVDELVRQAPRTAPPAARQGLQRTLKILRDELERVQAIDFFDTPARAAAEEALETLAAKLRMKSPPGERKTPSAPPLTRGPYQRRTWVTRPRPGIDRMACAWLILRFIDQRARFVFADADDVARLPKRQVPFDMFGAEFGHQGAQCSFETLCSRFGIDEPAVRHMAEIVHSVDLKDDAGPRPEAATIANLIDGLRATYGDDRELLQHGIALFGGLYASFAQRGVEKHRRYRATAPRATKRSRRARRDQPRRR
jgi:hypothetical protein